MTERIREILDAPYLRKGAIGWWRTFENGADGDSPMMGRIREILDVPYLRKVLLAGGEPLKMERMGTAQ